MRSAGPVFSSTIAGLGLVLSDPMQNCVCRYISYQGSVFISIYRKFVINKLILEFINSWFSETLINKHCVIKSKFVDGKFLVQLHKLLSWNREMIHPIIPAYWLVEQNEMEISRYNS